MVMTLVTFVVSHCVLDSMLIYIHMIIPSSYI